MIATAEAPSTRTQLTFFNLPAVENCSSLSRYAKISLRRKQNTEKRNERIRLRFNYLYNEERKRIDDVITILCEEFSLAKSSIETVLKG